MRVTSESQKITKTTIESAWKRRAPGARLVIRDKECKGLSLIANPTSMAWSYSYRPRGIDPATGKRWPNKALALGNPASMSPEDARDEARKARGERIAGRDPVREKKAKLALEQKRLGSTLDRLTKEYETALPHRPKMRGSGLPSADYVADEIRQLQRAVLAMGAKDRAASDIREADLRKLLNATAKQTATARARFGALSRFMDWCQDEGHIAVNPCSLVAKNRRPRTPPPRSNYPPVDQLALLWTAAEKLLHPVWRDLARFLIAVPCRRTEAAKLEWSHLDIAAKEWRQHGRMTKNNDPHRLFLTPLALEVLEARRVAWAEASAGGDPAKLRRLSEVGPKSGLVFPAPQSGKKIDTFSDIKVALVAATAPEDGGDDCVSGWTWHDFRRTFASELGEAGVAESVADGILNHRQAATRGGVLAVYQRSSRWPEQVRAMELWGRLLADAMEGKKPAGSVVPMVQVG
jgi:integrase